MTKSRFRRWVRFAFLCAAAASLMGGSCSEEGVYSEECADLSDDLAGRIASEAADRAGCVEDADCTYVAVVIPCNRDSVVNAVIAADRYDGFREAIAALSASHCDADNIDQCNAHCGTEGSLVFPTTAAACDAGACVAVEPGDDGGRSLPSSEICDPEKFVYRPEDLSGGVK